MLAKGWGSFLGFFGAVFKSLMTPSINPSRAIDSLDWETYLARCHSSTSNCVALIFALVYNLAYYPSETSSLLSFQEYYLNLTSLPTNTLDALGRTDDLMNPVLINNIITFYHGRMISRFCLVLLMSCCVGAFLSNRICIPDQVFQAYFQDYVLKELRGLYYRSSRFELILMRRVINANPPSSFARKLKNGQAMEDSVSCFGAKFK